MQFDVNHRYPMPFKEEVLSRTREINRVPTHLERIVRETVDLLRASMPSSVEIFMVVLVAFIIRSAKQSTRVGTREELEAAIKNLALMTQYWGRILIAMNAINFSIFSIWVTIKLYKSFASEDQKKKLFEWESGRRITDFLDKQKELPAIQRGNTRQLLQTESLNRLGSGVRKTVARGMTIRLGAKRGSPISPVASPQTEGRQSSPGSEPALPFDPTSGREAGVAERLAAANLSTSNEDQGDGQAVREKRLTFSSDVKDDHSDMMAELTVMRRVLAEKESVIAEQSEKIHKMSSVISGSAHNDDPPSEENRHDEQKGAVTVKPFGQEKRSHAERISDQERSGAKHHEVAVTRSFLNSVRPDGDDAHRTSDRERSLKRRENQASIDASTTGSGSPKATSARGLANFLKQGLDVLGFSQNSERSSRVQDIPPTPNSPSDSPSLHDSASPVTDTETIRGGTRRGSTQGDDGQTGAQRGERRKSIAMESLSGTPGAALGKFGSW